MLTLLALFHAPAQAATGPINFEDRGSTSSCFASAPGVTTEYNALGVTFSSPGSPWKVLNFTYACGWGAWTGFDGPQMLTANNGATSNTETMTFTSDVANVTMLIGANGATSQTIQAYNASHTLLGQQVLTANLALGSYTLPYVGIRSVDMITTGTMAVDSIRYDRMSIPVVAPASGFKNVAVNVNATGSADPDGGIQFYYWDCTNDNIWDYAYSTPTAATCPYPAPGTYTLRLGTLDTDGIMSTVTTTTTITNRLPSAVPNGAYAGLRGTPVALSAAGSADPDVGGSISKYEWDCTSDGTYDTSSSTPTGSTCTYTALGSFAAKLRVTDDNGGQATASTTVNITNRLPVAVANGPYNGFRGAITMNAAGSTDPDPSPAAITKYEWDCNNDNVYDVSGATVTLACTYTTLGTFSAKVRVTDNDGGQAVSGLATVTVVNKPPTALTTGPYSATAGTPVAVSAAPSSDPDSLYGGKITTYQWDCNNDGTFEFASATPTGNSCLYAATGSYTIALKVTDNDGGTATTLTSVGVGYTAPTANAGGPYTGNRNVAIAMDGSASKGGSNVLTKYEWDCTADSVYDTTSATPTGSTCTYPAVGTYTARLRVTDAGASQAIATTSVTINPIAPVAKASGPYTGTEGTSIPVDGSLSTDKDGTIAAWDWDCDGDGTFEKSGKTSSCLFADEGTRTITLRVTDDDKQTSTTTASATITNVAPTINTTASTTALEGAPYSYDANATDPGTTDKLQWALVSGPAGATIDASTGVVSWSPDYSDAVRGGASFDITVNDGDGGLNEQTWNLTVTARDDDKDGMWDGWEKSVGLNPNDPSDAAADPDADGLSNLEEFKHKQDPHVYDGPSVPVAFAPAQNQDADLSPSLSAENASDPQGDKLTYEFEIYADDTLTDLIATEAGIDEGLYTTDWLVTASLEENKHYWWRVRASDGWISSDWSAVAEFRVNQIDEAPTLPPLVWPVAETVDHKAPTFEWAQSTDPEGDSVTYDVEVWDAAKFQVITSKNDLTALPPANGTWTCDVDLPDGDYVWHVEARDPQGVVSGWSETTFTIATDESAPTGVAFVDPLDGDRIDGVSPLLTASEGVDAEGSAITYLFEVDAQSSFNSSLYHSIEVPASGTGTVEWDLAADSIELPENGLAYARVRGVDAYDNASPPNTISFYVIGENEAPVGLSLQSPLDGTLLSTATAFTVHGAVDPEGLDVTYDFVVAKDEALTDIVSQTTGVVADGGTASWTSTDALAGELYWSARAVDADGVASDFAPAWRVTIGNDNGDTDTGTGGGKCGCSTPTAGFGAWTALLGLVAVRRRRAR